MPSQLKTGQVYIAEIPATHPMDSLPIPLVAWRKEEVIYIIDTRQHFKSFHPVMRTKVSDKGHPHLVVYLRFFANAPEHCVVSFLLYAQGEF
jgi:hypothetical protein